MNVERWRWYSVGLSVLLAALHAMITAASGSLAGSGSPRKQH
jgi:hypothetical protein